MNAQIYKGMPVEQYLSIKAISANLLITLLNECPAKAFYQSPWNPNPPPPDDTNESDAGTIAHGILFDGSEERVAIIDPNDHPSEKTKNIPDGWTNKSIRAARDQARASGKVPIFATKIVEIRAMVDSARAFIDSLKNTEPLVWEAFQPRGGESEVTIVVDGCRIRPDRMNNSHTLIIDGKFTKTSAEPDSWGRTQLVGMGHYIRAAFYDRIMRVAFDVPAVEYKFLVVEQNPPYLCSLVGVDPYAMSLGHQKERAAYDLWTECVAKNHFPGYANRTIYPMIPNWVETQWMEKQTA